MTFQRVFDFVVWLFIAAVGIFAGYICFGILSSTADAKVQGYSVGGAIAGTLVAWGVLLSVYLQLSRSTNELQKLRDRADELQRKLIRGAPRPEGFEIELAERQRIVLARPKLWRPKGGIILDLELPAEMMSSNDKFPATFRCYFAPLDKGTQTDTFYETELNAVRKANDGEYPTVASYSSEMIELGGELTATKSLKIIAKQFIKIEIGPSQDTGKTERNWWPISREEFSGRLTNVQPHSVTVRQPQKIEINGYGIRDGAVCYVNGKERETTFLNTYTVQVSLVPEDVMYADMLEIVLQNPDVDGFRSNPIAVRVVEPTEGATTEGATHDRANVPEDLNAEPHDSPEEMPQQSVRAPVLPAGDQQKQTVFQIISRMRIISVNSKLETVYYFDFFDDVDDFVRSSAEFNQILKSIRYLD